MPPFSQARASIFGFTRERPWQATDRHAQASTNEGRDGYLGVQSLDDGILNYRQVQRPRFLLAQHMTLVSRCGRVCASAIVCVCTHDAPHNSAGNAAYTHNQRTTIPTTANARRTATRRLRQPRGGAGANKSRNLGRLLSEKTLWGERNVSETILLFFCARLLANERIIRRGLLPCASPLRPHLAAHHTLN